MTSRWAGRLAGKRALMTGAGGALGGELVRAFADAGADLVLTTRSAAKLGPLVDEVHARGRRAVGIAADFTDDGQVDGLAEQAWAAFGGVDVVLLSSQPANTFTGDLLSTDDEVWAELHRAIVWGPLRLMRRLAPQMMRNGGGSVVSVISSTGLTPTPGLDAYGLAKGGLLLLSRYMAKEWGAGGIRVNCLNPGTIVTGGDEARLRAAAERTGTLGRISLGRVGHAPEVIGAAVHLASDESSFTSGQLISVDGGRF